MSKLKRGLLEISAGILAATLEILWLSKDNDISFFRIVSIYIVFITLLIATDFFAHKFIMNEVKNTSLNWSVFFMFSYGISFPIIFLSSFDAPFNLLSAGLTVLLSFAGGFAGGAIMYITFKYSKKFETYLKERKLKKTKAEQNRA
jgi:uncharacterized protein YneF (UPF0154 family)